MPIPPPRRPLPDQPPLPEPVVHAPAHGEPIPVEPRDQPGPPPPKPPRHPFNAILQVLAVVIVISGALVFMLWEGDKLPNDPGEISRIRTAARMNPLPKDATNIQLLQPGDAENPLNNIFGIVFEAPELSVLTWLSQSPGTQQVQSEYVQHGVVRYVVKVNPQDPKPKHAEVVWNKDDSKVWISVPPEALKGD